MSEGIQQQPLYFTLGEAAKQAQVSKPTLSKAVKDGRLSAEKQPDGSYRIQPAELFRVYPQRNGSTGTNFDERETGNKNRLVSDELSRLREQLALLSAERDRERQEDRTPHKPIDSSGRFFPVVDPARLWKNTAPVSIRAESLQAGRKFGQPKRAEVLF